ncbi:DUF4064 domain-containing protein [Saccharibacillus sp. CPCC 101409]|uniref:DUF4064 domain-containing protein n=1 Tax=Saccharibacillus sp. CPCC 101409 TaxID=3058041 RepID=UPI002672412F|nr:DUF4064 domain-containing protein [Saccharibacillus sp. CPCC 101409]MDO3408823.1 DUF4064 domain-containing protein [Saccharibacillus sp. CPCC 101409]
MDNRFPPPDGKDDKQTGPDLRKDPYRNVPYPPDSDPYRSESPEDPRSYEERVNPPFSPYDEFPREDAAALKHSGLGIASFVLGLISIILVAIFFVSAIGLVYSLSQSSGAMMADVDSFMNSEEFTGIGVTFFLVALSLIASAGLSLIGAILGIIGLTMKNRKKVFAVIGTILNAICLLGGGGLLLFGTFLNGSSYL